MKKSVMSFILFSLFIFSYSISAQTLDEVLDKHFKAVNQEKIAKVQTVIIDAKILQGGAEIPIMIYQKRPNKVRTEGSFQGMSFISAYDGENGWMINPFMGVNEAKAMGEDEIKQTKEQANIDGVLYSAEEKGYKLELKPDEMLDSAAVHVINVIKPDSSVMVHYISVDKNLVVKTVSNIKVMGTENEVHTYFDNFKTINDVLMPTKIESKVNGQTVVQVLYNDVTFDKEIPDDMFKQPAK